MSSPQKTLSQDQITAFYHDLFVESQVEDFIALLGSSDSQSLEKVVDIGGVWFFCKGVAQSD